MKKTYSIIKHLLLILVASIFSEVTAQSVPDDPLLKIDTLPNGLRYYIRENHQPKNTALLYLVVKVGSVAENDDQQGIAHFIEHMAFNGTKDFPKNEIIDYLQKAGVRFGADLNAYTNFTETVYQLPIPTDDPDIFEQGFNILSNWAGYVSFDQEQIDSERGVVEAEDRQRRGSAVQRMNKELLPVLLNNSRYASRLPIGKMEVINTVPYDSLKNFYRKWYRPDLQAVIAVGDFDPEKVEAYIRKYFTGLSNSNGKPEPEVYPLPGNEKPSAKIVTDPEYNYTTASVIYRQKFPFKDIDSELKLTALQQLFNRIISGRINELLNGGEAPFVQGQVSFGPYMGGIDDAYALSVVTVAKEADNLKTALQALLSELIRIKKFGVTPNELLREKENFISRIEKRYHERDKVNSSEFVRNYVEHFLKDEQAPSRAYMFDYYSSHLQEISIDDLRNFVDDIVGDSNEIVYALYAEKDSMKLPPEEELLSWVKKAGQNVEPYKERTQTDRLLKELPEGGRIVSEKKISNGVTEVVLSNKMRVLLKQTNFKNDEVLFRAFSPGGTSLATDDNLRSAQNSSILVGASGLGDLDATQLKYALAGKNVSVVPYVGDYEEGFYGSFEPKDAETAFQILYAYFNQSRLEEGILERVKQNYAVRIKGKSEDPLSMYSDSLSAYLNGYHPRKRPMGLEELSGLDKSKALTFFKDRFRGGDDFTFCFVGSFTMDEMKPLLAKYLASIPAIERNESYKDHHVEPLSGKISRAMRGGLEDKSYVNIYYHGKYDFGSLSNLKLEALAYILHLRLTESLRERESSVYSPSVKADYNRVPDPAYTLEVSFVCLPQKMEHLMQVVRDEISLIKEEGVSEEDLEKFKSMQERQMELNMEKNRYWLSYLVEYGNGDFGDEYIRDFQTRLDSLSTENIGEAFRKYFDDSSVIEAVLIPEINN